MAVNQRELESAKVGEHVYLGRLAVFLATCFVLEGVIHRVLKKSPRYLALSHSKRGFIVTGLINILCTLVLSILVVADLESFRNLFTLYGVPTDVLSRIVPMPAGYLFFKLYALIRQEITVSNMPQDPNSQVQMLPIISLTIDVATMLFVCHFGQFASLAVWLSFSILCEFFESFLRIAPLVTRNLTKEKTVLSELVLRCCLIGDCVIPCLIRFIPGPFLLMSLLRQFPHILGSLDHGFLSLLLLCAVNSTCIWLLRILFSVFLVFNLDNVAHKFQQNHLHSN
jgi:hypothetical protein